MALVLTVVQNSKYYHPVEITLPDGEKILLEVCPCPKRKGHILLRTHARKDFDIKLLDKKLQLKYIEKQKRLVQALND